MVMMMTEKQVLEALKKPAGAKRSSKRVTLVTIATTRRKVTRDAKNWSAARFDAWLVKLDREGKLQLPVTHQLVERSTAASEAEQKAKGGVAKQKANAMSSVRKWVRGRTAGAVPKVKAAMLRQMETNLKREDGSIEVRAALVLCAAAGEMQVEDMRRRGGGAAPGDRVQEAVDWMVQQQWVRLQDAPGLVSRAKQRYVQRTGEHPTVIELGSGWEGATGGLRKTWPRVVTMDKQPQQSRGRVLHPEILAEFEAGGEHHAGLVEWARVRSDVSQGELGAVWASADCTQESTGQGMNKDKDHAAGVFATGKRTPEAQRALEAVFRGIAKAREKYPKLQYCIENVGYGALRNEKWITKRFGKGIVVRGCAYGLKSGKTYRLWLSPETVARFTAVDPRSPESCCEPCKRLQRLNHGEHEQAGIPKKGVKRKRISREGESNKAARNMVPTALAEHVGRLMREAWEED